MDLSNHKFENAILALISTGFVIWSAAFIYNSSSIAIDGKRYFCLFDDAMISMRYAWNFSHGLGLVWNQGEYVQGYTNLLMTLLMSLATWVFDKSTAALSIQILGVGFMLGIAFANLQIADFIIPNENLQSRAFVRIIAFLCGLCYYPLAYWSLMGMETGLLTLLLLFGILFVLKYTKSQKTSHLFLATGCLSLAYCTRNDSLIFAALAWAYLGWHAWTSTPKADAKQLWTILSAGSIYAFVVVGQFLFQYWYYGEILPNTYTLKLTGMPLAARLVNGIGFVTPFLAVTASILILTSLDLIFDFQREKLLLISIAYAAIAYQVYVGGDPWNYWRMLSPAMPLLTLLFINAIYAIILAIASTQAYKIYFLRNPIVPERYINQVLVASLTIVGLLATNIHFLREISFLDKPYEAITNRDSVNTAIALNHLTTSDATIGVFRAGAISYFTDRKSIDFLGKTDRHIAQLAPDVSGSVAWFGMYSVPGHNKYNLRYSIKSLEPTYVQSFSWGKQDLTQWAETHYVLVEYKGVGLFVRQGSPAVLWDKTNQP